jgi:hypothetical protein
LAPKKTLDTAQNLENKQSGIFLPAKSMVLKVVTGKILETLELRRLSLLAVPFWNCRQGWRWPIRRVDCRGDASAIRLSNIWYYLVDNIYNLVLSRAMGRVQEESGRTAERFPNWNQGGAWKKVGHHSVCVQLRKTPPKRSLDGAPSKVDRWRGCPGQPPFISMADAA